MHYISSALAILTAVASALNPVSPPKGPDGSGLIVDVDPSYMVTWEDGQDSDGTVCLWLFEYKHNCMAGFQIAGDINPVSQTGYPLTLAEIQQNVLKCVDQHDACENSECQALYPDPSKSGPVRPDVMYQIRYYSNCGSDMNFGQFLQETAYFTINTS